MLLNNFIKEISKKGVKILKKALLNEKITGLLSSIRIGFETDIETKDAFCTFLYGEKEIAIITHENYTKYQLNMDTLYKHILLKEPLISYKFFEQTIHRMILEKSNNIIDSALAIFADIPTREFVLIKPLYGGYLKNNDHIEHSGFAFISQKHIKGYLAKYSKSEKFNCFLMHNKHIHFLCYIETKTKAKDIFYAKAETNRRLLQLDNVLRFMSGNTDENSGLGMFNYNTYLNGGYVCIDEGGQSEISPEFIKNPLRGIQLDVPWFFPGKSGNDKLWDLLKLTEQNEIQQRILKAVEWIGRAINESDKALSFLQCLFAIECLLQDQNDFITKSITAQISEYAAFIVGVDLESRKEIEQLFRKLYVLRSKLAHGSPVDDMTDEPFKALWLAKQIVTNMLNNPEFVGIRNKGELRDIITTLRYR